MEGASRTLQEHPGIIIQEYIIKKHLDFVYVYLPIVKAKKKAFKIWEKKLPCTQINYFV